MATENDVLRALMTQSKKQKKRATRPYVERLRPKNKFALLRFLQIFRQNHTPAEPELSDEFARKSKRSAPKFGTKRLTTDW
jgi:hypothetical protein